MIFEMILVASLILNLYQYSCLTSIGNDLDDILDEHDEIYDTLKRELDELMEKELGIFHEEKTKEKNKKK